MSYYFFSRFFGNNTGSVGSAPASPTLAMADNGNGTGAVATVSGSTTGATNTLYSTPAEGTTAGTWTSRGSRTSDGTISASITTMGVYHFLILSTEATGGAISNLVTLYVSDGTQAIQERIMQAVAARIQGLSLTGVSAGNVIVRKVAYEQDVGAGKTFSYPCIQVSPTGQERITEGTNERDDIAYPVLISMMDLDLLHNQSTNRERNLLWRERIIRAFRNQRLSTIAEVYKITVEPNVILHPPNWLDHKLYTSFLVLRCTARQVRGVV